MHIRRNNYCKLLSSPSYATSNSCKLIFSTSISIWGRQRCLFSKQVSHLADNITYNKICFTYLKGRKRQIFHPLVHSPKPTKARLDEANIRKQEFSLSLPRKQQGPEYLSHSLLLPSFALLGSRSGNRYGTYTQGLGYPKIYLNHCAKYTQSVLDCKPDRMPMNGIILWNHYFHKYPSSSLFY